MRLTTLSKPQQYVWTVSDLSQSLMPSRRLRQRRQRQPSKPKSYQSGSRLLTSRQKCTRRDNFASSSFKPRAMSVGEPASAGGEHVGGLAFLQILRDPRGFLQRPPLTRAKHT